MDTNEDKPTEQQININTDENQVVGGGDVAVVTEPQPEVAAAKKMSKKSKVIIALVISFVILLIAALITVYLVLGDQNESKSETKKAVSVKTTDTARIEEEAAKIVEPAAPIFVESDPSELRAYPNVAPLTFTIPEGWTVEKTTVESQLEYHGDNNIEKIVSPTKKVFVEFRYHNRTNGFGFECDGTESQKYLSLAPTNLPAVPDVSFFEPIINDSVNNSYYYVSYLGRTPTPANLLYYLDEEGYCFGHEINSIWRAKATNGSYEIVTTWSARIYSTDFLDSEGKDIKVGSADTINDFFASDEYKVAKEILLSAQTN